jgi:hypothetical protein
MGSYVGSVVPSGKWPCSTDAPLLFHCNSAPVAGNSSNPALCWSENRALKVDAGAVIFSNALVSCNVPTLGAAGLTQHASSAFH